MNVLVLGGTRFMGRHLIASLLQKGHRVTMATRGNAKDDWGDKIRRVLLDRTDEESIRTTLGSKHYDVVFDSLSYCSRDVKILLDHISCTRYVMISTTAVYRKHMNTIETDFDPLSEPVIWCDRNVFPYAEMKRQAERALFSQYGGRNFVAVRFPFVIGADDYTKRLRFYIEHILTETPVFTDNFDAQMAFVRSDEAGEFLAFFAENDFTGAINGASMGTVSLRELSEYIRAKCGKEMIVSADGDAAPYNGEAPYSINTERASSLGFRFSPLRDWFWQLVDYYIDEIGGFKKV